MHLRVLDFGYVSPLRSQAIYHGIAQSMRPHDKPVLILVNPNAPYICVGMHQNIQLEIDTDFCQQKKLAVLRRQVGGGTVLLDENQLFFQFVYPRTLAPRTVEELYPFFIAPIVNTYRDFSVAAQFQATNDIQVNGKKIGGTGAASIQHATVFAGSFLYDFDFSTMANAIRAPSSEFRRHFLDSLKNYMTTMNLEMSQPPDRATLIQTLIKNLPDTISVNPIVDSATNVELEAIAQEEKELVDPEWLEQGGKRFVENGVKIAADTHLTEICWNVHAATLRIILIEKKRHVAALWIYLEKDDKMKETIDLSDALRDTPLRTHPLTQQILTVHKQNTILQRHVDAYELSHAVLAAAHTY